MTSESPFLVDFHCHLDLYPDFTGIVRKTDEAQVKTLAVTTTTRAFPRNLELTRGTRHVRAALGVHPQLVAHSAHELQQFEELLPQTRYVGEVGLDGSSRYRPTLDAQKQVFSRILELCAIAGGKVLSVHSVRAATPVLDLIEAKLPVGRGRVVLHWFTGSASEARRAVDLGCFFSINGEMLRNPNHRRSIAEIVPRSRLLTETDGPFVQHRGRSIRPTDVQDSVVSLSELLHENPSVLRAQIVGNLRVLVN